MSMYWILFIGIAIISYIVQASLQSKFKKYSKMPLSNGMGSVVILGGLTFVNFPLCIHLC